VIIGAAIWFVFLQVAVIKSICPFCMTAHGLGLAAALVLLFTAPIRPAPEKPWQQEKQVFVPGPLARKLWLGALAAVAILVAGQVAYQRIGFSLTRVGSGVAVAPGNGTGRRFEIYDGKFRFNLGEVPLLGSPGASNVIVSLFDYTCQHCRVMHPQLKAVQYTFSNQLVIVSLPMPLDSTCNYMVKQTPRPHTNACEYARLGLAVWRANHVDPMTALRAE
jgi:hypothetical protein